MPDYAELQVTSNYSFLRGASHIEELFAQARLLGLTRSASPTATHWQASSAPISAPPTPPSASSSAAAWT